MKHVGNVTAPDDLVSQRQLSSYLGAVNLDILLAGINGVDCVLSGGAVTAQETPDMTVAVAKAGVLSNSLLLAVVAANATIGAAHATLPRRDLVVITSAGAIAVRAGTAAAAPALPPRSANDVVLAEVSVPAGATQITSSLIADLRVTRRLVTIAKETDGVTFNTTLAIQTYFSTTLPSGLLLAGRTLRVRCGGNYLSNSGSPTWTLTIAYGGTTLFADVTGAMSNADADRGAWRVEFDLIAQANNAQRLVGLASFQPGAGGIKNAPATGIGDLAVTTHVAAPIRGTAAVDSDAADRLLTVQWTMSVSNVAVETVMDYATAELL